MVVNAQQRQPLAARFGFTDVSSSDGQAFLTAGRGEASGTHNARHGHGREPSALFYTHVSSRHAPFHTASIPPSGEAAYVIDGLLYHEADLSIAVHHTDGGGVSDHVFALAHPGLPFRPAHPQPRGAQTLRLRSCLDLARSGTVRRRALGRKADHGTMGRRAPAGGLGAHGHGQCVVDAQAPRCLSPAERIGARDLVPATATQIRIIFTGSSPATACISKARWHNLRSLALDALRHAGWPAIKGQTRQPLSPAWDALRDRLPNAQSRAGLSRFMSYCSARQIDPPQVTETTFSNFGETLPSEILGKEPAQLFRTTCLRWNAAVAEIEGWPPTAATVPNRSRRYAFDLTVFPDEFQADVAAFLACTGNQDPFAEDYAPSVKPSTIAMRRKQIAQMATALAKSGIELEAINQLATLVESANAKSILRFLRDRRGKTFTYLHQQALLLKTIARYWVKAPQAQIETISRVAQNLAVKRRAMTPKNSRRLRQFDIEANLRALLDLPDRVLAEVRPDTKTDARRVMLALAVGLLTVTAMRIDNLAGLEPDRHLVRSGGAGATTMLLIIPPKRLKQISQLRPSYRLPWSGFSPRISGTIYRCWPSNRVVGCSSRAMVSAAGQTASASWLAASSSAKLALR